MAAITASATKIQGQRGEEDDDPGTGELVAEGVCVADPGAFVDVDVDVVVSVGALVVVEVEVDVEVDVDVEVEVSDGDRLFVGASLVGAPAVGDTIGGREGSVGRLIEREAVGRFEPPSHATMSSSAIESSAIEVGRILSVTVASPFHVMLHLAESLEGIGFVGSSPIAPPRKSWSGSSPQASSGTRFQLRWSRLS